MPDTITTNFTGNVPMPRVHMPAYKEYTDFSKWLAKFKSAYFKAHNGLGILGVEAAPTNPEARQKYDLQNLYLYHELVGLFDDELLDLFLIEGKDDGLLSLKILKDHFEGSQEDRQMNTLSELMEIELSSSETLLQYTNRFKNLKKILDNSKVIIAEKAYIAICLKGLPERFNLFKQVLKQVNPYPNFKNFIELLLA